MFKRVISILILILLSTPCSFANNLSMSRAIAKTDLNRDSIVSVSVKSVDGKDGYEKHSEMFLNPASSLKLFSYAAIISTLGDNYNFATSFNLDKKGDLYLKLSADPMLSVMDLNYLAVKLAQSGIKNPKNIYVDDTIIDNVAYPNGWTVDDFWPNAPMISPYMVDRNTVSVQLLISNDKKSVSIIQPNDYKFSFINELQPAKQTNVVLRRDYADNLNIITISGTIAEDMRYDIPVLNPKAFYLANLSNALKKAKISYTSMFYFKKMPSDVKQVASISRPLVDVARYSLSTSDNLSTEMSFKVAGGKFASTTLNKTSVSSLGTTENGVAMFLDYYNKACLDVKDVRVVDASGVSRYNVLSTDWMGDALLYLSHNSQIKEYLPTPGTGTLSKRLNALKGIVFAKTGTIFGTSSLSGFIRAKNQKDYVFAIIIQNFNRRTSVVKALEDDIVNEIYEF